MTGIRSSSLSRRFVSLFWSFLSAVRILTGSSRLFFIASYLWRYPRQPWSAVLRRAALALPFVLLAGISNIIFDRATAFTISGIAVSYGVVSFFTLIYRTFLCVTAVLIIAAVTPVYDLSGQLRRMHVPDNIRHLI